MRIFLEKTVKIVPASGAPPPELLLPSAITIYSSPAIFAFDFPSKNNKTIAVNVLPLLSPHFCTYFSLQTM